MLAEWIIQRCTQKWIGTELRYENWPGYCECLVIPLDDYKAAGLPVR
jgi:hypothetical protein